MDGWMDGRKGRGEEGGGAEKSKKGEKTYVVQHLIARLETFSLEEFFQRFLLFTIDVAELMIATAAFGGDGDIKRSTGGDGTADSRHDDDGDVVKGDVC